MIGAEAVITEPSGALSVNQTGEEVWECPKEVTRKETTMTAESLLRMRPAFLNAPSNQKAQDAGVCETDVFRTEIDNVRNQWMSNFAWQSLKRCYLDEASLGRPVIQVFSCQGYRTLFCDDNQFVALKPPSLAERLFTDCESGAK